MVDSEFQEIKYKFMEANVDEKISMYTSVRGLSRDQYIELLKLFPVVEIKKLERALMPV